MYSTFRVFVLHCTVHTLNLGNARCSTLFSFYVVFMLSGFMLTCIIVIFHNMCSTFVVDSIRAFVILPENAIGVRISISHRAS